VACGCSVEHNCAVVNTVDGFDQLTEGNCLVDARQVGDYILDEELFNLIFI
jgi:hypothetical protein